MNFFWTAAIALLILQASVFCTTIFLHRAKTHRGLELHPVAGFLMHLELTLFTGIVPRQWVAVHRKHHHFSDQEGDPHSPLLRGLWTVLFGNFFLYRNEIRNQATIQKYTPDWKNDPLDKIPHMNFGSLGGLAIFIAMFGWTWGAAAWGFHAIAYILLNSMINSLGHTIGYRNYGNQATNLQWVALLTGGEGLHNNHHEYPTSARFALRRREIDPAWPAIYLLERCGLAKVNKLSISKAA
ncbi:MAG: fatty acid desaturase [Bryobacteraceae bacterium]